MDMSLTDNRTDDDTDLETDSASSVRDDLRYHSRINRESTFRNWNNINQDKTKLVDAGFYYTGNGDAVRCFSCDIGLADWKPHDDPWVEHARHSPLCSYLISNKGQEFINGVQEAWKRIYASKHRRYDSKAERIRSFAFSGWPAVGIRQTPEELAEAGFFYTGEADAVRCHYCDGGLRDWEPDDDPWVEHGRGFQTCKYVIETKGTQFIRECSQQTNGGTLDKSEEKRRQKELDNPLLTAAAISVRQMGYSTETVEISINRYIARKGNQLFTATDLMEIVFELEEQGEVLPSSVDDVTDDEKSERETADESEQKWRQTELENPLLTPAAMSVAEMGYPKETVEMAINKHQHRTGNRHFTGTDLMKIIFELEEKGEDVDDN